MNLVKKSLELGARGGIEASGGVEASVGASLVPALDFLVGPWVPASSSSSPAGFTGVLTRGFCRVMQDPRTIEKDRGLIVMLFFLSSWLTHLLWTF